MSLPTIDLEQWKEVRFRLNEGALRSGKSEAFRARIMNASVNAVAESFNRQLAFGLFPPGSNTLMLEEFECPACADAGCVGKCIMTCRAKFAERSPPFPGIPLATDRTRQQWK